MENFLYFIGAYNVFGSLILITIHFEKTGDYLLRKLTEIINEPYFHGPFGRMWLWWAATSNFFLGMVMILSTRWSAIAQRDVIILVLITYLIMYLVMIIGAKKPRYGRGIYVTHILWLAQIIWGLWTIIK